ncbi:transcriptional regulator [Clostridia bacterium]|nr:transcriptional regulator [Clostridia bacterium]
MNKADLINVVAESSGLSKKDTERVINNTIKAISDALVEGDKVQLVGFGVFEVKSRAARVGRNPRTSESISIPASRLPLFKAGKALKDAVAEG